MWRNVSNMRDEIGLLVKVIEKTLARSSQWPYKHLSRFGAPFS